MKPLIPFEGNCLGISSDGINFSPKALNCDSIYMIVCQFWAQPPPPVQSPDFSICVQNIHYPVTSQSQTYQKGLKIYFLFLFKNQ